MADKKRRKSFKTNPGSSKANLESDDSDEVLTKPRKNFKKGSSLLQVDGTDDWVTAAAFSGSEDVSDVMDSFEDEEEVSTDTLPASGRCPDLSSTVDALTAVALRDHQFDDGPLVLNVSKDCPTGGSPVGSFGFPTFNLAASFKDGAKKNIKKFQDRAGKARSDVKSVYSAVATAVAKSQGTDPALH